MRSYPSPKGISALSVSANGKIVASGSENGIMQRWDILNGEAVGRPMLGRPDFIPLHGVAISRDGTLIM